MFYMTPDAKTHCMIYFNLQAILRCNFSMAGGALDLGSRVTAMVEMHIGGVGHLVDSAPRDLFASIEIGFDFLNGRALGFDHRMAGHAQRNTRDYRLTDLLRTWMAKRARDLVLDVNSMAEHDGLLERFFARACLSAQ